MTYRSGEEALLSIVRGASPWNPDNTSANNWDILNTGKSNYLILRPGEEFEAQVISIDGVTTRTTWSTVVEVWRLHKDFKNIANLEDDVDLTIREIEKYPYLGKGASGDIQRATVSTGGPIESRWSASGGPTWLVQEFTVSWVEERRVAHSE